MLEMMEVEKLRTSHEMQKEKMKELESHAEEQGGDDSDDSRVIL